MHPRFETALRSRLRAGLVSTGASAQVDLPRTGVQAAGVAHERGTRSLLAVRDEDAGSSRA